MSKIRFLKPHSFLLPFLLIVSLIFFSVSESAAQKGGKGRYKIIKVKKDARINGYKIITEGVNIYFEAINVKDPDTKEPAEGEVELRYKCTKDDPPISLRFPLTGGVSGRVKVTCLVLIEPQILLLDEPD